MFGFLNINKPRGPTSRDVVTQVQRTIGHVKAGHCGTLDPLATGVLVVCLGRATRLVSFVQQSAKQYLGTFLLGETSDTEDVDGQRAVRPDAVAPSPEGVQRAIAQFRGPIMQRPPAYSAIKVGGQRAYALARRGEDVQLSARPITIHQLELVEYQYPRLVLDVTCSAGTYVRSLGRDIGETLGTGALMAELCRTRIGSFSVDAAVSLAELTPDNVTQRVVPPIRAVEHLPRMILDQDHLDDVVHGRAITVKQCLNGPTVAAVNRDGELVAILQTTGEHSFKPTRVFQ